ncbi:MAG: VOC family protein, partial [Steroidobacteraceae bacterium]
MPSADVQGKFLWHELMKTDPGAAGAFYGKVLGWTPQAWDKDPSYTVLLTPKGPVGGVMRAAADGQGNAPPAQWLAYIGAANVDETAAAAQRLGGRIVKGAADIAGGGGRYAVLADPQGGTFGIHSPPTTTTAGHASEAFAWHELATPDHAAAFRFYRELFGWEQLAVHD